MLVHMLAFPACMVRSSHEIVCKTLGVRHQFVGREEAGSPVHVGNAGSHEYIRS